MKKIVRTILAIFIAFTLIQDLSWKQANAQSPDGTWSDFENISRTPATSSYPSITTDKMGRVHVLWGEDVGGPTGVVLKNPAGTPILDPMGIPVFEAMQSTGNSLYYSRWEGNHWIKPVEIFYSSIGNIDYPDATIDPNGILHVVWFGSVGEIGQLSYSYVPVNQADDPKAWAQPRILVDRILYAYYPVAIRADAKGGLHIACSVLGTLAGLALLNSYDGGATWSEPTMLYTTNDPIALNEGIAPIRMIADEKSRLHLTFTRYGRDANGRAIYYSQSSDNGMTWTDPFEVATWQLGWYEVDWLNTVVINDEIHLVWEGGPIALLNERISRDSGKTWGAPHQILPNLRGENGYTDLVVDSANQLYLLVVQRADGYILSHGIWFSKWIDDQWDYPVLLGTQNYSLYSTSWKLTQNELLHILRGSFTGDGLRYQRATIVNGNELFVVVVNESRGDIYTSHTKLNAPVIAPQIYPTIAVTSFSPLETARPILTTPTKPVISQLNQSTGNHPGRNDFYLIFFSATTATVLFFGAALIIRKIRK